MNICMEQVIELVHSVKPFFMDRAMSHDVTVKGLADFVTRADTSVQSRLFGELSKQYPGIQLMGEEDHMQAVDFSKPMWILDPIDGTTNLIYSYCHSAVSLGYYENKKIGAAVIYNPFTEETFHAVRGQGAFLNGRRIRVTQMAALKDSLIAIGTSPYDKEMTEDNFRVFKEIFRRSLDIRRSGSAALDLAYLACGRVDGFLERNLKPWDFSAGALLVEEAGGQVTDYSLMPLDYSKNQDILASNGKIHEELQKEVRFVQNGLDSGGDLNRSTY